MRIRNDVRREPLDDGGILNYWCNRDVRSLDRLNAGNRSRRLEEILERRHVGFKVRKLFVKERVLAGQHYRSGAFTRVHFRASQNVLERKRTPYFGRRPTKLATASTATGYFDDAKG